MALRELPVLRQRGVCCALPVEVDPSWARETSAILKAVADPTRLGMLVALSHATEPVCICDFTDAYGLTQPTIFHHVAKLKDIGLVESEKRGIWVYYRLSEELSPAARRIVEALTAS